MYRRICTVLVVLGLLIGLVPTAAPAQGAGGKIYWTDSNNGGTAAATVSRANFDGSSVESLVVPAASGARFLALDPPAGKVYWIESGAIRRADLNGGPEEAFMTLLPGPMGIAIDPVGRHIYWTDTTNKAIYRVHLEGADTPTALVVPGQPRALALDVAGGKIYWTERLPSVIRRANLDLTAMETLMPSLVAPSPGLLLEGIAIDAAGDAMYWADVSIIAGAVVSRIRRANLDGTAAQDIVVLSAVNGIPASPTGVAVNADGGSVYWTVYWTGIAGTVQRANLDGTGAGDVITGLDTPWGLALQPAVQFARRVRIDIKPGGDMNSINPGSHGVIPVAILSEPGFDAPVAVDRTSLTFGRTGTEASFSSCAPPQDANHDGLLDLLCHFYTDQTEFQPGDTQGVLKGKTVDGQDFDGVDAVRIIF